MKSSKELLKPVRSELIWALNYFVPARTNENFHTWMEHQVSCTEQIVIYSKKSVIRTNLEQTLVQISESPNYRSATENMFREVIKLTSPVF
jgi:hypothetical protein